MEYLNKGQKIPYVIRNTSLHIKSQGIQNLTNIPKRIYIELNQGACINKPDVFLKQD